MQTLIEYLEKFLELSKQNDDSDLCKSSMNCMGHSCSGCPFDRSTRYEKDTIVKQQLDRLKRHTGVELRSNNTEE